MYYNATIGNTWRSVPFEWVLVHLYNATIDTKGDLVLYWEGGATGRNIECETIAGGELMEHPETNTLPLPVWEFGQLKM